MLYAREKLSGYPRSTRPMHVLFCSGAAFQMRYLWIEIEGLTRRLADDLKHPTQCRTKKVQCACSSNTSDLRWIALAWLEHIRMACQTS